MFRVRIELELHHIIIISSLHSIKAEITTDINGNIPSTLIKNQGIIRKISRYL